MVKSAGRCDFDIMFLNDTPLLDVRAPMEFAQGAFPASRNYPILNDEERHEIGICYKRRGRRAALDLGHRLVSGKKREERIRSWCAFAERHPGGYLYCFRGGLRSRIAQQWMAEAGIFYPRVEGGYKALRRHLVEVTEAEASRRFFVLLSGRTGSGKTAVIRRLNWAIDLEGLARHRGSSFGNHVFPQPGQVDFENALAVALLKHRHHTRGRLLLEDESRCIGSLHLPRTLFDAMARSPLVILEAPLEHRVDNVLEDYVVDLLGEYCRAFGEEVGFERFGLHLRNALDRIRKRLGGLRHDTAKALLEEALNFQRRGGGVCAHRSWITLLLREYYDPMYDYQLSKKCRSVLFRGEREAVLEWLTASGRGGQGKKQQ